MKELRLDFTIDETNLILEGLGNLPFAKVFALVSKIQEQASQQLEGELKAPQAADPPTAPQVEESRDV